MKLSRKVHYCWNTGRQSKKKEFYAIRHNFLQYKNRIQFGVIFCLIILHYLILLIFTSTSGVVVGKQFCFCPIYVTLLEEVNKVLNWLWMLPLFFERFAQKKSKTFWTRTLKDQINSIICWKTKRQARNGRRQLKLGIDL